MILLNEYNYKKKRNSDVDDEEILSENALPPWMQSDVLYYFKFENKDDDSEYIGIIEIIIAKI